MLIRANGKKKAIVSTNDNRIAMKTNSSMSVPKLITSSRPSPAIMRLMPASIDKVIAISAIVSGERPRSPNNHEPA